MASLKNHNLYTVYLTLTFTTYCVHGDAYRPPRLSLFSRAIYVALDRASSLSSFRFYD